MGNMSDAAIKLFQNVIDVEQFEAILSEVNLTGLQQDSRLVGPGDCFLAVTGLEADGRSFISAAINSGAVLVIQEARDEDSMRDGELSYQGSVPVISVQSLLHKLSSLAANYYGHPTQSMRICAITGTNGKTSCSQLLAQLLTLSGQSAAMLGTMGYGKVDAQAQLHLVDTGMTTPGAVNCQKIFADLRSDGVNHLAIEVSSHSLEQGRVAAAEFDVAIFTNLSRDHLDYHGDMASYGAAKARLFDYDSLQAGIINIDDSFGGQLFTQLEKTSLQLLSYSVEDENADFYLRDIEYLAAGIRAIMCSPWGSAAVEVNLLGRFNLSNILAVVAAACALGFSFESIVLLLPALRPVNGRMQVLNQAGVTVIVDYAHTPDALENALQACRQHCDAKLQCVFGSGGDRDVGKRLVMGEVAAQYADVVIVTSDNPRTESPENIIDDVMAGVNASIEANEANPNLQIERQVDRRMAIENCISNAKEGDCILIAGKGHEAYQQIGLEKIPFDDVKIATAALDRKYKNVISMGSSS